LTLLKIQQKNLGDITGQIDIIENSTKKLRGYYWTGQKTTGDITLEFWDKEIFDEFSNELGEHPVSKARENKS
jgi:hypothetical protein